MTDLDKLNAQKQQLQEQLAMTQAKIEESKKAKMIQCAACAKRTKISTVSYIQTLWYERPYSCSGGDSWHDGEGCFVCPKCNVRNRLLSGPARLRESKEGYPKYHPYTALKHSFKEIVRIEDTRLDRNFVNHYVDLKRKVVVRG